MGGLVPWKDLAAWGSAPARGPHLLAVQAAWVCPAWVAPCPRCSGYLGGFPPVGLLSPGGSVQNGKFWLGEQLQGEIRVPVLLPRCYLLHFLKLLSG